MYDCISSILHLMNKLNWTESFRNSRAVVVWIEVPPHLKCVDTPPGKRVKQIKLQHILISPNSITSILLKTCLKPGLRVQRKVTDKLATKKVWNQSQTCQRPELSLWGCDKQTFLVSNLFLIGLTFLCSKLVGDLCLRRQNCSVKCTHCPSLFPVRNQHCSPCC